MSDPSIAPPVNTATLPPSLTPADLSNWRDPVLYVKLLAITLSGLFATNAIPTEGVVIKVALVLAFVLTSIGFGVVTTSQRNTARRTHMLTVTGLAQARVVRNVQRGSSRLDGMLFLGFVPLLAAFALIGHGCATTTGQKIEAGAKAMSGTFAACAKADLGQIIPSAGTTLLGDVAQKIEGNSPTLESDLGALAAQLGIDAVSCAVAAVVEVLEPTGQKIAGQPNPGIARAETWIANQAPAPTSKPTMERR